MTFVDAMPATPVMITDGLLSQDVEVTLQTPLRFSTHFELAVILQGDAVLHRLEFEDKSISTVLLRGVVATYNLEQSIDNYGSKRDNFEQSLDDLVNPRKRRRMKTPMPEDSSSNSLTDMSDHSSDHISICDPQADAADVSVPQADAADVSVPQAPPNTLRRGSFFFTHDKLDLVDLHNAPTGSSKCFICGQVIPRDTLRGGFAYDCTKPHRYIHGSCIPKLDGERRARAFSIIESHGRGW